MSEQQKPALVTLPELKTIFGIPYSKMTLWRREKDGTFPKRVQLSASRVAWRTADIDEWVKNLQSGIGPDVLSQRIAAKHSRGAA